jgi:hypothetical protein
MLRPSNFERIVAKFGIAQMSPASQGEGQLLKHPLNLFI